MDLNQIFQYTCSYNAEACNKLEANLTVIMPVRNRAPFEEMLQLW